MKTRKKSIWILSTVVVFCIAAFIHTTEGVDVEGGDPYCDMVEIWNSGDGAPKDRRLGWAPYKGTCDE